jgi:hypothetical protein
MKVVKIKLRYIPRENRETEYYDVGKIWFYLTKNRKPFKITWNKWFLNRRIVLFICKSIK